MKIVLATGIYPPAIGGPATYCLRFAEKLESAGHEVVVLTYGHGSVDEAVNGWPVFRVSPAGGPLLRWWRYAKALRGAAHDADIVYAFSSVSCGVPLWMARLGKSARTRSTSTKTPKKILRLGGDFFWERYTDHGGTKGLRAWYASHPLLKSLAARILKSFDYVVFSTRFQEEIYEEFYDALPPHSVIENALPPAPSTLPPRAEHTPLHVLFLGRFVGFKNLPMLLEAMEQVPECTLTLVGGGPLKRKLKCMADCGNATRRIHFVGPVDGRGRRELFAANDVLIIPSLTEISPNVALEARAAGMPVLLTRETGLSEELRAGMVLADLSTPEAIAAALRDVANRYGTLMHEAEVQRHGRTYDDVLKDHLKLFSELLSSPSRA